MRDGLWLMAGLFLLYCACSDLRCGMISVKGCLLAAGAGTAVKVICAWGGFGRELSEWGVFVWMECIEGLIPGLLVMGLAVASGEQIGKGDAWIVLALGVLVGAGRCVSLFVTALIVSLPLAAAWYRMRGNRGGAGLPDWPRERLFPFAPSLFLAYVLRFLFS